MICKFARKGMTPSQIGVLLRDQHGVPLVGGVTGSKILRILKGAGLAPELPEDLYFMIKKAGEPLKGRSWPRTATPRPPEYSHAPLMVAPLRRGFNPVVGGWLCGCSVYPQAPGAQPEGQGRQVPSHSGR